MKRFILVVLLASILCTCSRNDGALIAGGATETVNARVIISDTTVTVCVKSDTSIAVNIVLCDSAYSPVYKKGFVDSAVLAGENININFSVLPGTYNAMIFDRNSGKSISFMSLSVFMSQKDTLSDSLSDGNDLNGTITLPPGIDLNVNKLVVYFEGTILLQKLSEPEFSFVNVPAGNYRLTALITSTIEKGINSLPITVSRQIDLTENNRLNDIQLIFSR
jgi:hypothetical protein